ncbi:hypothetical protein BCR44DRAFT_24029 [Catenaria anguillulae PL171]|uniref:Uncharacterized protein n=1 Tax=Catenaria anguillulae PL171 TaxID=765915 RepID=A0A1Y2I2Y3_9FUNG|nr:hypothetical protein BCR44DRAFT_24029 [Catenaria anguillulae PL171]
MKCNDTSGIRHRDGSNGNRVRDLPMSAMTDSTAARSGASRPSLGVATTANSAHSTATFVTQLWAAIGGSDGSDGMNNDALIPMIQASSNRCEEYRAVDVGRAVAETAAWLQQDHGVGRQHVVAVVNRDGGTVSARLAVVILALFRLRASYVPLSSFSSTSESDNPCQVLLDNALSAGCNLLISIPGSAYETLQLDPARICVCKLEPVPSTPAIGEGIDDDHIAYTVHTSGTTNPALPTRVSVLFSSFATHIAEFGHIWPTDASTTKIALTTPLTFDPHLIELFHAIRWKLPLIIASRLADVIDAGATLLSTTPSRLFLELGRDTVVRILEGAASITHLYLGGEPFPIARLHALVPMDQWRIEVANLYGTTENSVWAGCHVLRPNKWKDLYLTHGVPVNPALMHTEIKVDEERGGAVTIGGQRRKCFVNGQLTWFDRTNDAACIIGIDEQHIIVHGRIDRQIKRNGHRIQLELIESIAHSTPCDEDGASTVEHAIAIHNPQMSTLTLAIHPPSFPLDRIWSHFRSTCPPHSIPDTIVHIDSVPVTANGKVDGRAVAQLVLQNHLGTIDPLSAILQVLTTCTATPTDLDPTVSYFTQIGGDSLSAVRVIRLAIRHLDSSAPNSPTDAVQTRLFHALMHEPISIFMDLCHQSTTSPGTAPTAINKRIRSPSPPCSSSTPSTPSSPARKRICAAPAMIQSHVADLGKCIDAPPILAADPLNPSSLHILVGSHAGQWCAYAINARDSPAIHTLPSAPRIEAGMLIHPKRPDLVLIPTLTGTLFCCAWRTGSVVHVWDLGNGEPIKCQPVADAEGRVWVGTHAGRVYGGQALEDGGVEWGEGWDVGGAVGAKVVFHDGYMILFLSLQGRLVCIKPSHTSTICWSTQLAGPIFATPLVIPETNTVFLCSARSLAVVSLASRAIVCERTPIPHPIFSSPVWVAKWKLVVFGTHGNQIHAVDPESLAVVSVIDFTAPVFATVVIVPDDETSGEEKLAKMVVAVTDGRLMQLTAEKQQKGDGQAVVREVERVECRLPGQLFSSPCLVAGKEETWCILVGCRDNGLYECKLP